MSRGSPCWRPSGPSPGTSLQAAGEGDETRARHGEHYAALAERLRSLRESRHQVALAAAEAELDNFREALAWAVPPVDEPGRGAGDLATGLRLCAALGWVWWMGGYVTEGRNWHERVIARAGDAASSPLAACLGGLANLLLTQGEFEHAHEVAHRSLAMARSLDDPTTEAHALGLLGTAEQQIGDVEAARATLQETVELHRRRETGAWRRGCWATSPASRRPVDTSTVPRRSCRSRS